MKFGGPSSEIRKNIIGKERLCLRRIFYDDRIFLLSVVWEQVGGDDTNIEKLSSIGSLLVELHESLAVIQIIHNMKKISFSCLYMTLSQPKRKTQLVSKPPATLDLVKLQAKNTFLLMPPAAHRPTIIFSHFTLPITSINRLVS